MRSFHEYIHEKELLEFGMENDSNDAGKREVINRLYELSKLAIEKEPEKLLSFFKTIQDDEIQNKIRDIENEGGLQTLARTPPEKKLGVDDEVITPNTSDSSNDSEGGGSED